MSAEQSALEAIKISIDLMNELSQIRPVVEAARVLAADMGRLGYAERSSLARLIAAISSLDAFEAAGRKRTVQS